MGEVVYTKDIVEFEHQIIMTENTSIPGYFKYDYVDEDLVREMIDLSEETKMDYFDDLKCLSPTVNQQILYNTETNYAFLPVPDENGLFVFDKGELAYVSPEQEITYLGPIIESSCAARYYFEKAISEGKSPFEIMKKAEALLNDFKDDYAYKAANLCPPNSEYELHSAINSCVIIATDVTPPVNTEKLLSSAKAKCQQSLKHLNDVVANKSSGIAAQAQQQKDEMQKGQRL